MTTRTFVAVAALLGFLFFTEREGKASLLPDQAISVDYASGAWFMQTAATQAVFQAMKPGADFTAPGPDGLPLFSLDFGPDTLTITGLRNYTNPTYFEFHWLLSLPSGIGYAFNSASLVSSSLYSVPPFTFPVEPTVSFDDVTDSIAIDRFLTGGGNGTPTVHAGGSVVVAFTVVPEPSAWAMAALGTGAAILMRRVRRQSRPLSDS